MEHRISFLENHLGLRGVLAIDKLIYSGFEREEHLVVSVITEDGTVVDADMVNRIMELPAEILGELPSGVQELDVLRRKNIDWQKSEIERINKSISWRSAPNWMPSAKISRTVYKES